jgi:elongation factor Ts
LREKGIAKAAKKADAVATEGTIKVLIKGNSAIILEINSQTDFVSSNEMFKSLANEIALTILENGEYDINKALKMPLINSKTTIEQACLELTGKIGEKISVRRYEILIKEDKQQFSFYEHFNGRVATLLVLNSKVNEEVAKDVAMHAAAMAPKFLSKDQVDKA